MSRITELRKQLAERSLDAMWVTSPENHRYISGFHNPDGWALVTTEKAYLFADFRYIEAAKREAYPDFRVIMPSGKISGELAKALSECGAKKVGFEDDTLSCRELAMLKDGVPGVEFVPAGDIFDALRIFKDDKEIDLVCRAQKIAEDAFGELLGRINYNMTETEVAAELEYLMKRRGADDKSFDTIAISGSSTSSPHGVPQNRKLEKGFLTVDFGALVEGYHSDMTRTVVIGKADEDMKKVYNTVRRAQEAVLETISVGKSNFGMDKIARDIIYNAGYEGCFGHSLGHGVGLLIHEKPNLSPASPRDMVLEPRQIVTVEPGIYIEGKYGVRIEDMVLITETGMRNLTSFPKDLIEL